MFMIIDNSEVIGEEITDTKSCMFYHTAHDDYKATWHDEVEWVNENVYKMSILGILSNLTNENQKWDFWRSEKSSWNPSINFTSHPDKC